MENIKNIITNFTSKILQTKKPTNLMELDINTIKERVIMSSLTILRMLYIYKLIKSSFCEGKLEINHVRILWWLFKNHVKTSIGMVLLFLFYFKFKDTSLNKIFKKNKNI